MREADTKEANVFSQPNEIEVDYNANDGNPLHDSSSHKLTKVMILVIVGALIGFLSKKRLLRLSRYLLA